ncbi:MAG: F0F1 ATP synthase subunit gamma [Propionivibrio sp.]|nr:F0F1 ATP synthase subunit gamma [Propionivibrio sp.]
MGDSTASLQRKIASAGDLQSVVRTMKAMAASSVGQYENAVRSLEEYYRTVNLGLVACIHTNKTFAPIQAGKRDNSTVGVIVIGSDQGLVGQFNEVLVSYVTASLENMPGQKTVWAIGERIQSRLAETPFASAESFVLPNSIGAITPLVGQILIEMEKHREDEDISQVYLFHNRPKSGAIYTPVSQRLLPLDDDWQSALLSTPWPTKTVPEVLNEHDRTFLAVVREYLFVSLFRTCAESLASENASHLAAMQRAEKNIDELLEDLSRTFHRLRQSSIDEELFDVISGFEALGDAKTG